MIEAKYNPGHAGIPAVTKVVEVTPAIPAAAPTITVELPLPVALALRYCHGACPIPDEERHPDVAHVGRAVEGVLRDVPYPLAGDLFETAGEENEHVIAFNQIVKRVDAWIKTNA